MAKLKTYCIEIEGSNCLLTPRVRATHFAAGDKNKNAADFIQMLFIKAKDETQAQESAVKLLEKDPTLKLLVTNTEKDPITFKVVDVEVGFDAVPPTKKIAVNTYFFYSKEEQFDGKGQPDSEEVLKLACMDLGPADVSYSKISKNDLFEGEIPVWNPVLSEYISNTIIVNWDENDAQIIHALPEAIKNLYYLWWFQCEAGGNGISGFVLQSNSHHIKGAYLALKAIAENSLSKLLGHAIAMTIDQDEYGAEYCESAPDLSWFRGFTDKSSFQEIESIDRKETYDQIDQLDDLIVKYITENIEEIAE
jgi:hypothetical protein